MEGSVARREVWTRAEAIARLRETLMKLTDDEHSMCQVAAERGIFCNGFRRWRNGEFDRGWRAAIGRSTHLSRKQLEELANVWQLAEQIRQRVAFACDAETLTHGACRGWAEFDNAELARHCLEILGKDVVVIDGPAPSPAAGRA